MRERLRTVCRGLGHAACRFAAGNGGGDPVPLLRLADRAYEIDTLLLLVGTSLIPDSGRDSRWWGEIERLVAEVDGMVGEAAAVLGGVCVPV